MRRKVTDDQLRTIVRARATKGSADYAAERRKS